MSEKNSIHRRGEPKQSVNIASLNVRAAEVITQIGSEDKGNNEVSEALEEFREENRPEDERSFEDLKKSGTSLSTISWFVWLFFCFFISLARGIFNLKRLNIGASL